MNNRSNSKKNMRSWIIGFSILFVSACFIAGCSKEKAPEQNSDVKVLVLDDCGEISDSNEQNKTDEVLILDSNCELIKKIDGFQASEHYGENKTIAVSEDGRLFAVCEAEARKISIYETYTGKEYWSHVWPDRVVHTAAFMNDKLYVFGTRFVMSVNVDEIGKKSIEEIPGFWNGVWLDVAYDKNKESVWAVGSVIRKYDINFNEELKAGSIFDSSYAGAFSVDTSSDGFAWVAVQESPERDDYDNRLLKISPDGDIIETLYLDLIPNCVRVDKSDDSVWVTGMTIEKDFSNIGDDWPETLTELDQAITTDVQTFTHKYNANGDMILELDRGGYSIAIDSTDKSVWVACYDGIVHYSNTGEIINEYNDVSTLHKWIAIVPEGEK